MKGNAVLDGAIDVHTPRAQLLQKTCPVRLRHQDDRGIGGVQGGSHIASQAIDDRFVIRTEENLVTTWSGSFGRFGKREAATHESLAGEHGVDRGQQVARGRYLLNVTIGAQAERLSDDLRRGLLAHEEKARVGGEPADSFRDLESIHLRQVDIEQNQIRLQRFDLLNGLQAIRCLGDLELRPSLKHRANELAERRMVLDDENPQRHSGVTITPPAMKRPPRGVRMKKGDGLPRRSGRTQTSHCVPQGPEPITV